LSSPPGNRRLSANPDGTRKRPAVITVFYQPDPEAG
jgi:hypothetical protein